MDGGAWQATLNGVAKSWTWLSDFQLYFQVVLIVKNPPANAGDIEMQFDPWVGKIPWRREWLPTPVFWPGEFHGLYSPWGHRVGQD